MTPPQLDRVVKKCLAKERDDRWQSAKDLADELKWIAEAPERTKGVALEPKRTRELWRRVALATAAVAIAVAGGVAIWNLRPTQPRPVVRAVMALPPGQQLAGLDQPVVALYPGGSLLAYVASTRGRLNNSSCGQWTVWRPGLCPAPKEL